MPASDAAPHREPPPRALKRPTIQGREGAGRVPPRGANCERARAS